MCACAPGKFPERDAISRAVRRQLGPQATIMSNDKSNDDDGRLGQLRSQVEQVKEIMQDNVNKALEREPKIEKLGEKSELLKEAASEFKHGAERIHQKLWWQNVKLWIILVTIILVILAVIITVIVVVAVRKGKQ